MTLITLPLSKLHLSPMNVRQTGDGDDTSDLEASILAHGMLSHLIVHKLPAKRGQYGVLAGGRRLRALQRLRDRGQLRYADGREVTYQSGADMLKAEQRIMDALASAPGSGRRRRRTLGWRNGC